MGVFSKLFDSKKALDIVTKAGDAAFFTQEEKSKYFLDLLKAYEPFKLAQRVIVLMVLPAYLLIYVMSACLLVATVFMEPCIANETCKIDKMIDMSKQLAAQNNETLGLPVSLIIAFYFAGGCVEGIVNRFKK